MAVQNFDVVGAARAGEQYRVLRDKQIQQQQDDKLLRELSPQIQAGDPSAYSRAAVVNPEGANAALGAGDMIARRAEGLIKMLEQADTSNPRAAQALWQQYGVPFARQFSQGNEPTANWAEAKPMLQQLKARIEMAKSQQQANVQSTQILANGNIGVVTRTGQVVDTGQKAAPSTQLINEPGQTPYLVTTGRGQVGATTAIGPSGAPQAPPMGDDQIIALANQMTQAGMPQAAVEAWMRDKQSAARGVDASGAPVQLPSNAALPAPMAQRNPTVAENAAAKTDAEEATKLRYLPESERIKMEADIARAGGSEEAKQKAQQRAELEQLLPKVQAESQHTVALIDKALNHPGREVATGLSSRLDPRNFVAGTEATNFRVLLDQLRGGTFLQAFQSLRGGGAITETEGKKAEAAIARLETAQTDEAFIDALKDLRKVASELPGDVQRKLMAAGKSQPNAPAKPVTEADYAALPSGALFVDPDDGKTYRKP